MQAPPSRILGKGFLAAPLVVSCIFDEALVQTRFLDPVARQGHPSSTAPVRELPRTPRTVPPTWRLEEWLCRRFNKTSSMYFVVSSKSTHQFSLVLTGTDAPLCLRRDANGDYSEAMSRLRLVGLLCTRGTRCKEEVEGKVEVQAVLNANKTRTLKDAWETISTSVPRIGAGYLPARRDSDLDLFPLQFVSLSSTDLNCDPVLCLNATDTLD